jgi:glycine hydroxymethyltransferase
MDKKLFQFIGREIKRQRTTLNVIASENLASPEMLGILGSPLVNKYSEGYPGKRYYPGNTFYDEIENLAVERALKAFGLSNDAWGVNVQAYSGSPANQAIYFALAKPGDALMGLSLASGGHLTHGHKVNFSGVAYRAVQYGLHPENGRIDYETLEVAALRERPKIIVSGATAYPRTIDFERIGAIAKKARAYHVADISHIAGLVAGGVHPSPFPYADVVMMTTHKTLNGPRGAVIIARNEKLRENGTKLTIKEAIDRAIFPGLQGGPHNNVTAAIAWALGAAHTPRFKKYAAGVVRNAHALGERLASLGFDLVSHGTDTHLLLLDLKKIGISGTEAENMLEANGILANRNSVPGDATPFHPSGIRLGTPALTSRGMKEREMLSVADMIGTCLLEKKNVAKSVASLAKKFPLSY